MFEFVLLKTVGFGRNWVGKKWFGIDIKTNDAIMNTKIKITLYFKKPYILLYIPYEK